MGAGTPKTRLASPSRFDRKLSGGDVHRTPATTSFPGVGAGTWSPRPAMTAAARWSRYDPCPGAHGWNAPYWFPCF